MYLYIYVTSIPMSVPMQLEGHSSPKVIPLGERERWSPSTHTTETAEMLFFPPSLFLPQTSSFML